MLNTLKFGLLAVALVLSSCAGAPAAKPKPKPQPTASLTFQNGETVTIQLAGRDPALEKAFQKWVKQGVYTQAPVYRQLPGIFVLTGKPRLAGNGFVSGPTPTTNPEKPNKAPPETKTGQVGLVKHADGTYGPELILMYGKAIVSCCEAPANIAIGTITKGRNNLHRVQRGDNLEHIQINP